MTNGIVDQLIAATTEAERSWVVTRALLATLPEKVGQAAIAAAVPHWFDAAALAALLEVDAEAASDLLEQLASLPFTEGFAGLGSALHDLTRRAILDHLVAADRESLEQYSRRAYDHFRSIDDPQNRVEATYHLLMFDQTLGMPKFRDQMREYRRTANFSAAENLLRNGMELVRLQVLGDTEAAEIERMRYQVASTRLRRGKFERASGKSHFLEAMKVFHPSEDSSRYESADPAQFEDLAWTSQIAFLQSNLSEAQKRGDPVRQKYWRIELGIAEATKENYETSLQHYNDVLLLNPDYPEALAGRGQTYTAMGKYDEALADLDRAIELDDTMDWVFASRGETHSLLGRFEAALADFNRAIDLSARYDRPSPAGARPIA
jgi:tetratricopeptide (TPR) repeat protein